MSEKLSERSVKWRVDHDVLGGEVNVRAMTRKQVAAEIADLEAKLEAMKRENTEFRKRLARYGVVFQPGDGRGA